MRDQQKMGTEFYESGLRFSCTQCSACCRYDSGYVFLSPSDLWRIAQALDLPEHEVVTRYCLSVHGPDGPRISLREQSNKDCIMWRNGGCSIYAARPTQCRTFPFWPQIVESKLTWEQAAKDCPGINCGTLHSAVDITKLLKQHQANREEERKGCG